MPLGRSSHSFFYLFATCIACWIAYTCVSIFNYLEGVSSAVKNDLSQYFSVNERITNNIETLLPEISVQGNHNVSFTLEKNEQIGIEGVNIMPDHYSFYSGSFIAQGNVQSVNFDLSKLLHKLDEFWTEEDRNASPQAFFVYYGQGQEFAYIKSRINLTATPPEFSPFRYRQNEISLEHSTSFLTSLEQAYPRGRSVVILVTPVFSQGKLLGDLGMTFDLQQLMQDSLGPWLSQYMGLDIDFRDQSYSIGESRFLPFLFNKHIHFNDITIKAYIQNAYITQYVLPWFMAMLLIMTMVYYVLEKNKQAAVRFSFLSKTDELTGLYNKRILHELEHLGITSGTIFYIDMNHFKSINDVHGHDVGDSAIRYVASRIKECMRASDICIRAGGDEFLIVSNDIALNKEAVIQRLRNSISGSSFMQGITLTVSIGHSDFEHFADFSTALNKADKAMYSDKALSRDVVTFVK